MTVPDFLIWHCAGCGAPADGKKKPCDCATNVGTRTGPNGSHEETWWDRPRSSDVVLYEAAKSLANFCERSLNAGPITKNPGREAMLWRNLRAALAAFEEENKVIS